MSYEVRFEGSYSYASHKALQKALDNIRMFLEEQEEEIIETWEESHEVEDDMVLVNIEVDSPEDDFPTYEIIVEILARHADTGSVKGAQQEFADGDVEVYAASDFQGDEEE